MISDICTRILKIAAPIWCAGAFLLSGCRDHKRAAVVSDPDVLAAVGSRILTAAQLAKDMPAGLSSEDSSRFVRAYVKEWVESHLISDIASRDIDMADIDRIAEDYRRRLIMMEYRRQMFRTRADEISDDSLRSYYESHKQEFVLERPMVRGTYLKVPDDVANLRVMRRLYLSDKPADADQLEKEVLIGAIHYDYFRDRWVDWEQIETRIPYDFGQKPNLWPVPKKHLDTSAGGFTYLLYITDVLPAGASMPYEAAREDILVRMLNADRRTFDAQLLQDLWQASRQNGDLILNIEME